MAVKAQGSQTKLSVTDSSVFAYVEYNAETNVLSLYKWKGDKAPLKFPLLTKCSFGVEATSPAGISVMHAYDKSKEGYDYCEELFVQMMIQLNSRKPSEPASQPVPNKKGT
jgi:hypothetical protein